ncbi:hypothetical protein OAU92_02745 [Acidimicrobiia bacterium]|jgi:hypothetical protein|nr:hypothetical protein [Acidimicrobiia bacterium]MDC3277473.1 hypothetical protein [Acidimicrobiia bacterium]
MSDNNINKSNSNLEKNEINTISEQEYLIDDLKNSLDESIDEYKKITQIMIEGIGANIDDEKLKNESLKIVNNYLSDFNNSTEKIMNKVKKFYNDKYTAEEE